MAETQASFNSLHSEVADALSRGLLTPAEAAGITQSELFVLSHLASDALSAKDAARALLLTRALVVLSPYWSVGWALLTEAWRLAQDFNKAALARAATELLRPPAPPNEDAISTPAEANENNMAPQDLDAIAQQSADSTQVLHDGRTLPLIGSQLALHHDTVTARVVARALLHKENHLRTATMAGGDESTQTAIVERPRKSIKASDAALNGRPESADATSIVTRQNILGAAQKRRLGHALLQAWTDTDVFTTVPPRPKAGS